MLLLDEITRRYFDVGEFFPKGEDSRVDRDGNEVWDISCDEHAGLCGDRGEDFDIPMDAPGAEFLFLQKRREDFSELRTDHVDDGQA